MCSVVREDVNGVSLLNRCIYTIINSVQRSTVS